MFSNLIRNDTKHSHLPVQANVHRYFVSNELAVFNVVLFTVLF